MVDIDKQKVVVIGHSSTLRLGIVRAVAELGCDISIIIYARGKKYRIFKPFDCYSKYVSSVQFCPIPDSDALISLLMDKYRDAKQKVILIPTSDVAAVALDDNKGILSEHFVFPHVLNSFEPIRYWMDKENQKKLAREMGLNVPNSKTIDIQNNTYTIPDGIEYPCFTKALSSIVGGKRYFSRCDNEEELNQVLLSIGAEQDAKILVEDYKEIEREYAVLGFSNGREVVFPGIIHLLTQAQSPLRLGVAMVGQITPIKGFEDLLERFRNFVVRMGFVGVFDIDFYYSSNQFYFGEMNLRPGASGYAITKLGVNLPEMVIRHFRREDNSCMKKFVDKPACFVNEQECEQDWLGGGINSTQYHQIISSADISFINDNQDPNPQRMFELMHKRKAVKKALKRILNH